MPALSSVSPEKVATPFWAVAVSVPPRVAPPGLLSSATVTVPLKEVVHVARAILGGDGQAEAGYPAATLAGGCAVTTNGGPRWTSKAPMSTVPLTIRGKPVPRWSVVKGWPVVGSTARALLPASMAGLPGKRAMVWVGPPLSCSRRVEPRVGDADLVAVDAVGQAAGAAGADQVVRAGRGHRAGDVVGRGTAAGAVGVQRDDRVIQGECAVGDDSPPPNPPG